MTSCLFQVALLVACVLSIRCTTAPGAETHNTVSRDTCASCGVAQPEDPDSGRLNLDFLEAVKRHILSRLQMRERPNITHPVPKAAMVTALRKLHAGKVREDGRVEIPNLDGHPMSNEVLEETSEIISFAETGTETLCATGQGGGLPKRPSSSDSDLKLQFIF